MIWTLRAVAYVFSWLVVWLSQLADALDYRQQVLARIQTEPEPIPIPVRW